MCGSGLGSMGSRFMWRAEDVGAIIWMPWIYDV